MPTISQLVRHGRQRKIQKVKAPAMRKNWNSLKQRQEPIPGFGAWRPDAFLPLDEFKALMDGRLREMTETPPSEGYDRVLYAGLPEWEAEREHRAHGVPLHPSVVEQFTALAAELGVPFDVLR